MTRDSPLITHHSPLTAHYDASQTIGKFLVDERCVCKSLWLNDNKIRHDVRRSRQ